MPDLKHPGLRVIGEETNKNAKTGNAVEQKDSKKKDPARCCWVMPSLATPAGGQPTILFLLNEGTKGCIFPC